MHIVDCDFDNPSLTCPRCGFIAEDPTWRKNCKAGVPAMVGTEVFKMLAAIGATPTKGCKCKEHVRLMNSWGASKCAERRAEIVGWLKDAFREQTATQILSIAAKATSSGLFLKLNPLDPFGSLVDEAIRRSKSAERTDAG